MKPTCRNGWLYASGVVLRVGDISGACLTRADGEVRVKLIPTQESKLKDVILRGVTIEEIFEALSAETPEFGERAIRVREEGA